MVLTKSTTSLTIDSDLKEMVRVRKIEDSTFNFSELINDFLRDYFKEDIKDLNKRKLKADKTELKRRIALIEAQEKAIEYEKEKQQQEWVEKEYGKGAKYEKVNPDELDG